MSEGKEFNPDIDLNERQSEVIDNVFANDNIKEICLYGSGRSGKSFLVAYYNFLRAIYYPGSFQLFIRKTHTALISGVVTQTFPALFKAIHEKSGIDVFTIKVGDRPFVRYVGSPIAKFVFYNGSEIRFLGLDTQTTNRHVTDKILSQEYLTITYEEGSEMDFSIIEKCKTRLAQKINHFGTGKEGIPKWITTLNPTTFDSWDYIYFHEFKNPISKEKLTDKEASELSVSHFHINDNLKHVSVDYLDKLNSLSPMERRRFLDGRHGENFEGEIFKTLNWEKVPDLNEFEQIVVYTDPSYKSGAKNDYKATGAIGKRQGAYWLLDCEAMQCTTQQMILNCMNISQRLKSKGWEKPVTFWFENAGMPDDFSGAVQNVAENSGWVCPYKLDGRQKGDKYARIESVLVPLNDQGKLFFNEDLRAERVGNLINVQFLNFKKNLQATEHDDIPDMMHGGITIMNVPMIQPGGVGMVRRVSNLTL